MTAIDTKIRTLDTGEKIATNDPGEFLKAKRLPIHTATGDLSVGPIGHLAQERRRLDNLTWDNFEVTRYGATIGAELHGICLLYTSPSPRD